MSDWKNVQYKDGKMRTSEGGGGGGSSTLAGLDDVNISSASDGQVLKYDDATSKWVNANESGGGHTYSTTEQVVGTWIDGKPVYEIVKPITTTSGNYNFDVSSLNIDFLVDLRIQIKNVNGGAYCNGTYWQASNDYFNYYLQSSKQIITFRSGSGYAYGTGHVILQYTKTTD